MSIATEMIDGLTRIYSDRGKMIRDSAGNMLDEAWIRPNEPVNYTETEIPVGEHEEVDEEA